MGQPAKNTTGTLFEIVDERQYVICRSPKGGYKAVRVRKRVDKVPAGWQVVDTVYGWERASARVAEYAKGRDSSVERSIDRANERIRAVIGQRLRAGVRFRVTEAELATKGLSAVLAPYKLRANEMDYVRWIEQGRPAR